MDFLHLLLAFGLAIVPASLLRDAVEYTIDTLFPEEELRRELREHGIKKKAHLKLIIKWILFAIVCLITYVVLAVIGVV